ncbi:Art10p NDAI_0J02270 [Naumovozyma dairenensis CBS 421]|uniref:Arrestin-like N-terminal domain-containing protein n=1 Tax=Naumovozyma dairenensis (strain ATCC 10597 / BCRC 20456 / CBS 421 / NBRC 0211 / NRRL Y-12639) TaxID=1071378 RepID=G0WH41_NAUDC|nr:hypothetical protein NDAI_0J02270 [Naumovozyma dairenensis CBS 421]CCD27119.1 hypothetical protein NDAI_0J02270 [Naumovozyma dairenensis CBS 421]
MAPKISIVLAPPLNGQFYSSNDEINGTITLNIAKSLPVKKITVIMRGYIETMTKFDQEYMMTPSFQEHRSFHMLVDNEVRVFPPDNVWDALEGSSKPFKIKPGEYSYHFIFPKMPRKPRCLKNHRPSDTVFVKSNKNFMPPTFNMDWKEFNKIDNLDLYYYSMGKILYNVQVQIELGKAPNWFRPFDKFLREYHPFEFIPDPIVSSPSSLLSPPVTSSSTTSSSSNLPTLNSTSGGYANEKRKQEVSSPSQRTVPSSIDVTLSGTEDGMRTNVDNDLILSMLGLSLTNQTHDGRKHVYKSTYKIGLPDGDSNLWVEVRSNEIQQVYRNDPLFKSGCNKFDSIFLMIKTRDDNAVNVINFLKNDKNPGKRGGIKPLKFQLNLLEVVTYLSQGVGNENFSSLRLMEFDFTNNSNTENTIFDINEMSFVSKEKISKSSNSASYYYTFECELKLKDIPSLQRLYFNEEDYKHRGNRLYSFKTCTIKREFSFQLLIDWEIISNGGISSISSSSDSKTGRQSEVIISPMQIFCQTRNNNRGSRINSGSNNGNGMSIVDNIYGEVEALPRYVPPPGYSESPTSPPPSKGTSKSIFSKKESQSKRTS